MATARLVADCPSVLFIVYTPGADAEARGYEPWLISIDNPFFNAIPGVHHYANWKIERELRGGPLAYSHFDFQGLAAESDLERVWFNPDLDAFRTEWIRLWGYGRPTPTPVQANAYLMRPAASPSGTPQDWALITAGRGAPPAGNNVAWRVDETIRKHFATGKTDAWLVPAATENLLGFDWVAVRYGEDLETLAAAYVEGPESVAFVARLIAAPPPA
jgi:hypothetical protein